MTDFIHQFSEKLIYWYSDNYRELPWRNTNNPYYIWLSEIILQQTRVEQGLPYFEKFVRLFPNISDLSNASEDEVLKAWEGLGYYSRARNLHYTAKYIDQELAGVFPNKHDEIIKLKGVGPYTAAAIASFAFKEKVPAIDGNVYRVLSRIFEIDDPIDTNAGKKQFKLISEELISKQQPDVYNQAMMELGATICLPKKPNCIQCLFHGNCGSSKQEKWKKRPIKSKKLVKRHRYFDYFVLQYNKHVYIKKRGDKDIWKGLYEFYLIESQTHNLQHSIADTLLNNSEIDLYIDALYSQNEWNYQQDLTHQKLHINLHVVILKDEPKLGNQFIKAKKEQLTDYAFPKTLGIFINDFFSYL